MPEHPELLPSVALAAYAESLADGRRVIVFGDSSSGLADHLLDRGARLVHVYDPDATRVAEAATRNTERNVAYAPLGEGGLAVREGAFDLAIVENLAELGDTESVLARVKRTLSPRGVALVASANPDVRTRLLPGGGSASQSLDYYGLYDAVAERFTKVKMLGQTPFLGYAIVDFAADGEPEPTLDAGFVPGGAEEPEWFVALASEQPVSLEAFSVVQLPFRLVLARASSGRLEEQLRGARAAERHARDRMAALEDENSRLRRERQAQRPDAQVSEQVVKLKQQLNQRDAWIAELESRASTADARADEADAELDELRSKLGDRERELAELRAQRAEQPTPSQPSDAEDHEATRRAVEERDRRITQLERELDKQRELVDELSGLEDIDSAEELGELEEQLRDRAREIRLLEDRLRQAERVGRELLMQLEEQQEPAEGWPDRPEPSAAEADTAAASVETAWASAPSSDLSAKLDRLAQLNAQREADLTAARWRIDELSARLREAGVQPESSDLNRDLERARAELQRQAALIDQLRRHTSG